MKTKISEGLIAQKPKLIVILGPTSSGKTGLSIKLAKKYSGGIVSADSRQVYKGMNIGSGKVTKKEMQNIPHHLLDVANPKRKFTVSQFQKLALKEIKNIQKQDKLPFLVGGTGFYIQSIVNGILIPEVKPNWELRKKLEKKSNAELFKQLRKLDPQRAKTIDKDNPRRLIRALEIILTTKKPVSSLKINKQFNCLQLGIKISQKNLEKNIAKRLEERLTNSEMIKEVKKLRKSGLSFKRLEEFGLEYRAVAQYLQNKISLKEMKERIQKQSEQFAKRQMTWFKRDKSIKWIKNQAQAEKLIERFLSK